MGVIKIPKEFVKCVRNGGKVKTKDLGKGKYMHICYDKNGNSYAGEVLLKKKPKTKEKSAKSAKNERRNVQRVVRKARAVLATLEDLQKLKKHFDGK